jgi:enoyl-CoA hydratase/carnithine racemase
VSSQGGRHDERARDRERRARAGAATRLNRPERKNALTGPLIDGIVGAFRDAAHDDDVWAVAITGNGDAFCSGRARPSAPEVAARPLAIR